jgi:hypothetical protein
MAPQTCLLDPIEFAYLAEEPQATRYYPGWLCIKNYGPMAP